MFSQTSTGGYLPWLFDLDIDLCATDAFIRQNYAGLTWKILKKIQDNFPNLRNGCPISVRLVYN